MSFYKLRVVKELEGLAELGVDAKHVIKGVNAGEFNDVIEEYEDGGASVSETVDFLIIHTKN